MANPDRERLIEVVGDALRLPRPDREAYIRAACGDAGSREEALSLLAAAETAGGFMDGSGRERPEGPREGKR